MGLEIDKNLTNPNHVSDQLNIIKSLNSQKPQETEEDTKTKKTANKTEKKDLNTHFDTYKKSTAVSDSIEKQMEEQRAKIKEISENLAPLLETYNETEKTEDEARATRYKKSRALREKELNSSALKRSFNSITKKYKANTTDSDISKKYFSTSGEYQDAVEEKKLADQEYDIADTDAYDAIQAHNSADTDYMLGLSQKRDAAWDLVKLSQRYTFAKINEEN